MQGTIILDNGAHRMKAGFAGDKEPRLIPNFIVKSKSDRKRVYVADELDECYDKSALYFVLPFERGYLVNWDVELKIWDRVFSKDCLNVDFQESRLLITDPSDVVKAIRDVSPEIVFETYQYQSFLRTSAPSCVAYANYAANEKSPNDSACLIVDSGHSFTHIVPCLEGRIFEDGLVRIDVGGKVLTNQFKEWISYRQLNVLEETYIMNQCKEDVCFVSTDLNRDIQQLSMRGSSSLRCHYLLPDFVTSQRGCIANNDALQQKSGEAIDERAKITLGVERIATPEILFHPSDVDIPQMGIPEAIQYSLSKLNEDLRYLLLKKIVLIGGNSLFRNYKERIEQELRPLVSDCFDFCLELPTDPVGHAWRCASSLLAPDSMTTPETKSGTMAAAEFAAKFVTRAEYNENGANICRKRFHNFYNIDY